MKTQSIWTTLSRFKKKEPKASNLLSPEMAMSVFLQPILALTFIFALAWILDKATEQNVLNGLTDKLGQATDKIIVLLTTPEGQVYEKMKKQEIKLQKQLLINALDAVENSTRQQLAINGLFPQLTDEDGQKTYAVPKVLAESQVVDDNFIKSCGYANENLTKFDRLAQSWMAEVMLQAAAIPSQTADNQNPAAAEAAKPQAAADQNPPPANAAEILTPDNEKWLKEETNRRLTAIYADTVSLQNAVVSEMHRYFREHLELFVKTEVGGLVKQYLDSATDEQQRQSIIDSLTGYLFKHAKEEFSKQNIRLLSEN